MNRRSSLHQAIVNHFLEERGRDQTQGRTDEPRAIRQEGKATVLERCGDESTENLHMGSLCHLFLEGFPAREAGIQLMPEANLVLALLPAKIDEPSIAFGREVNQTLPNILQRNAQFNNLLDQRLGLNAQRLYDA